MECMNKNDDKNMFKLVKHDQTHNDQNDIAWTYIVD